jgi:hypothetical protein
LGEKWKKEMNCPSLVPIASKKKKNEKQKKTMKNKYLKNSTR